MSTARNSPVEVEPKAFIDNGCRSVENLVKVSNTMTKLVAKL